MASLFLQANLGLAFVQVLFGIGSVVGELGLPATNPVLFALIREAISGPALCLIALSYLRYKSIAMPQLNYSRYIMCGFAIFLNQFCATTGVKVAGGVAMAAWQPTQPIFSLVLGILLGYERFTIPKAAGILIAFLGVAFMVLFDAESSDKTTNELVVGNLMFFLNCLGSSCYVIASKPLLRAQNPPIVVVGFSYTIASVFMTIACVIVTFVPALLKIVCPPDEGSDPSCGTGWSIPKKSILPLAYWIVFSSIICFGLITWANRYVNASLVSVYTVIQPVSAALLAIVIIATTDSPHYNLKGPKLGLLGVIGICIGLSMVVWDAMREQKRKQLAEEQEGERTESHHVVLLPPKSMDGR
jgi:drug/metabolite transporter (DMT)-like permease